MSLGWKVSAGLFVAFTMLSGWLKIQLSEAEKQIAVQEGQIEQYKANEISFENALETQKNTVEQILTINEQTGQRLSELSGKIQEAYVENEKLNSEINTLRQTEAKLALEKPYQRGLAAGDRLDVLMQRISGTGTSESSDDTHDTDTP